MSNLLISLSELSKQNLTRAGGKGAALGELIQAGLPVPPGFVILAATFKQNLPEQQILEQFDKLNVIQVAVRSSAIMEDGQQAAWAGQLDSVLNVTRNNLIIAIKKCRASLDNARVKAYSQAHQPAGATQTMAVIVQAMIPSEYSGVMFSQHPTQPNNNIVIEAVPGLGEQLVSGTVTPDHYELEKNTLTITKQNLTNQQPLLNKASLQDLAKLVLKIEHHFGWPVDVEWTIANKQIYIVQSRPITALNQPLIQADVWSNMNLAEILPGVNPPLVTSTLISLFNPAAQAILNIKNPITLIRTIKGRLYFNVTLLNSALQNIIHNPNFSLTKFFGGTQTTAQLTTAISWSEKLNIGWFGLKSLPRIYYPTTIFYKQIAKVPKKVTQLQEQINATKSLPALLMLQTDLLNYVKTYMINIMKALLLPLSSYFIYSYFCQRWLPTKYSPHVLLASGNAQLHLTQAFNDLWDISEIIKQYPELCKRFLDNSIITTSAAILNEQPIITQRLNNFFKNYGYRCVQEMNFSKPRWQEDRSFIMQMLKQYIITPAQNKPRLKQQKIMQQQTKLLQDLKLTLPRWKYYLLTTLLNKAKRAQYNREWAKDEALKIIACLRNLYLKIGQQLVTEHYLQVPNDVFLLTHEELHKTKPDQYQAIITKHKQDYINYENVILPDIITNLDKIDSPTLPPNTATSFTGLGVSNGCVTGLARIVHNITEINLVQPGEILVTDHTDPGWTPVFVIIKGLVTNTGGLLSHASIVAREYGLPAIVNIPHATEYITDGQTVTVDANNGKVYLK
ncbi:MAG: PEP/pyruvate-binding domain-containing protein [Patescibacteria group bacterium]|jgi:pyruvate,water dikinase